MRCSSRVTRRNFFLCGVVGSVLLFASGSVRLAAQEPGTSEKPRLRLEYFEQQRAYPRTRIPPGALQRAQQQLHARWPAELAGRSLRSLGANATETWRALGPAPLLNRDAGRISTIAIHPHNPDRIYIGAAQGGVWRTTNGGATWTALTDTECSLAMGSLALDPVDPQIIYAGTGELHFSGDSYYGCGVLRSTDGGDSWVQLGASLFDTDAGGARISKILVDPVSAGSTTNTTVYVASNFGVFRSVDSGVTWSSVLPGIATDLVMDPVDARTLYVAIGSVAASAGNGVFKSTDGGVSWARLEGGFPTSDVGRISLAVAPSAPATLYAAVQNGLETPRTGTDGRLLGIWKSTDAGVTWTRLQAANAACGTQCWYDLVIAVHPQDAERVFFGGVFLYRSTNGGQSFANIVAGTHVDQHAIAFHPGSPGTMYVGNDGGIYRSTNGGTGWVSVNGNMQITQFYAGVSLHPTSPEFVLGGTQDNGTLEFGGPLEWPQVLGGDGGFTAIDFLNPDIAYAETQWASNSNFSGPRRRDGPGMFSVLKVAGINLADRALFIPPMVMDRSDPTVLYFGTFRLYRTSDRGESWTPISDELSRTAAGSISAISPAAADPRTIYAGTSDGHLFMTTDAGVSWTLRNNGLPDRYITDIAIDAGDAMRAIVSVSGFGTGHVFATNNGGASWQNISGNLPDMPVNAVLTDATLDNIIYIGTDLGIFRSHDGGTTWTPFNEGLPNVAVFDLAYNASSGLLVAATHGRGMFGFAPVRAARLVLSGDDVLFSAIGDSVRLTVTGLDPQGQPIGDVLAVWRSLDPAVAVVDGGLVRAVGNGSTHIIASLAGSADTAFVRVQQVVAGVTGLPDTASLVIGEARQLEARAVDRNANTVNGELITWTSSDSVVAAVDDAGRVRARSTGITIITALSDGHRDTLLARIFPPAITSVGATAAQVNGRVTSAAGSRVVLLRLDLAVDGVEPVRVTQLGFDVQGDDSGAQLILVRDADGDGRIGSAEPELGVAPASVLRGETRRVTMSLGALELSPNDRVSLLVAVRMSGAARNGAHFSLVFRPEETRSVGLRSSAEDRLNQPAEPVPSLVVQTTLLGDAQRFSMSANPVRTGEVTFNFSARPRTASVYTVTGRLVVDLLARMEDEEFVRWDLTNSDGSRVGPGVYLLVVDVGGDIVRERLIVLRPGEPQ